MQNNVTTLETSKKLKAAKFNEGAISWFEMAWIEDSEGLWLGRVIDDSLPSRHQLEPTFICWAWAAQEIANQLPSTVQLECNGINRSYTAWFYDETNKELLRSDKISAIPNETASNMVEALAALWLRI